MKHEQFGPAAIVPLISQRLKAWIGRTLGGMIKLIIDVPALRKPISKSPCKAAPKSDAPSGRVEAPDELFDLPHLNVGFRYILNLTHVGKILVRSGSDVQNEFEGVENNGVQRPAGRRSDLRALLKLIIEARTGGGSEHWQQTHLLTIMDSSKKRKLTVDDEDRVQRSKGNDGQTVEQATRPSDETGPALARVFSSDSRKAKKGKGKAKGSAPKKEVPKTKQNIKKLVPPRPFPTVPTSESATGPRSAHKEGKNYICITRKTPLAAYLRRCKDVVLSDGCVLSCDYYDSSTYQPLSDTKACT